MFAEPNSNSLNIPLFFALSLSPCVFLVCLYNRNAELCDAVKKIQSTFRGKAFSRKTTAAATGSDAAPNDDAADNNGAGGGDADTAAAAAAPETPTDELADIDLGDPDLAKAASKIQAKFRVKRK